MLEDIDVSDFFDNYDLDELWNKAPNSSDQRYISTSNRVSLKSIMRSLQQDINFLKENTPDIVLEDESNWNTRRAFARCKLYTTDTTNEAIANYIISYLEKRKEYLLRKAEIENMENESFLRYILSQIYGNIPSELEYNKLRMMGELKK